MIPEAMTPERERFHDLVADAVGVRLPDLEFVSKALTSAPDDWMLKLAADTGFPAFAIAEAERQLGSDADCFLAHWAELFEVGTGRKTFEEYLPEKRWCQFSIPTVNGDRQRDLVRGYARLRGNGVGRRIDYWRGRPADDPTHPAFTAVQNFLSPWVWLTSGIPGLQKMPLQRSTFLLFSTTLVVLPVWPYAVHTVGFALEEPWVSWGAGGLLVALACVIVSYSPVLLWRLIRDLWRAHRLREADVQLILTGRPVDGRSGELGTALVYLAESARSFKWRSKVLHEKMADELRQTMATGSLDGLRIGPVDGINEKYELAQEMHCKMFIAPDQKETRDLLAARQGAVPQVVVCRTLTDAVYHLAGSTPPSRWSLIAAGYVALLAVVAVTWIVPIVWPPEIPVWQLPTNGGMVLDPVYQQPGAPNPEVRLVFRNDCAKGILIEFRSSQWAQRNLILPDSCKENLELVRTAEASDVSLDPRDPSDATIRLLYRRRLPGIPLPPVELDELKLSHLRWHFLMEKGGQ